jgi:Tol biopolymer transport system component
MRRMIEIRFSHPTAARSLLVHRGRAVAFSALGGEERLVAQNGTQPRFSPDGNWIAYSCSLHICVVSTTGGKPRTLNPDFAKSYHPIWSPDGRHLLFIGIKEVFQDFRETAGDWWVSALDEGTPVKTGAFELFKRHGLSDFYDPSMWTSNGVLLFTATLGDSHNVWQVPISPKSWQVLGTPGRLTFGAGREIQPSMTSGGRLVFSSVTSNMDIWKLPIDANQGKVVGEMQRLTQNTAKDIPFDLSADGRRLLFLSTRSGTLHVWLKDLQTGKESPLTVTGLEETWAKMTANESKIAYEVYEHGRPVIYVIPAGGSEADRVCEDCGGPWDWSADGQSFLYRIPDKRTRLGLFNLVTGKKTEPLKHPKYDLWAPQFSPDGGWIAFLALGGAARGRLFISPFRGDATPGESEWIALRDGLDMDSWPRWAPDGNLLYFVSWLDGYGCLWGQRVEAATKRPIGSAFPVHHFHNARLALSPHLAVARDTIIFDLIERTGNIWITKVAE